MPRYSDDFRAKAVAALKVAGFPDKHGALVSVANQLHVPVYTLRRWSRGEVNPPPDELVTDQLRDMRGLLIDEMYTIMNSLPEKRDGATYRQLALSLSTYFDKLPLLNNIPPIMMELIPVLRDVIQVIIDLHWSPHKYFEDTLDELQKLVQQRAFPELFPASDDDALPDLDDTNDLISDFA